MAGLTNWLVHRADDLNHYTCPRRGGCWSKALCLYDSELLCWEAGDIKTRPTWHGSRHLAMAAKQMVREGGHRK